MSARFLFREIRNLNLTFAFAISVHPKSLSCRPVDGLEICFTIENTSPRTVTVKFILPEGSVVEAKAAKFEYQDPEKVLFLVFAWITKTKNKHCIR